MKSTLKRKLIVRETVGREAHGISNALQRFRRVTEMRCVVWIRMDRLRSSSLSSAAFLCGVRQHLLEPNDKPRKKVADLGWCYSLWCASWGPTEESRHMLSFGLASPLSVGRRP